MIYFDPGLASAQRGDPIVYDDSVTISEDPDPNTPVYLDFIATDFPTGFPLKL